MKFVHSFIVIFIVVLNVRCTSCKNHCVDLENRIIEDGKSFAPSKHDPCLKCTCKNGKQVLCMAEYCKIPKNCKYHHRIPGTCCKFDCPHKNHSYHNINASRRPVKNCWDKDGLKVRDDMLYTPRGEHPCMKCICKNGRGIKCQRESCHIPKNCKSPTIVRETCCTFRCKSTRKNHPRTRHNNKSNNKNTNRMINTDCHDYKGNLIRNGQQYQPNKKNPCLVCTCAKGHQAMCFFKTCPSAISCDNNEVDRNACCRHICKNRRNKERHDKKLYDPVPEHQLRLKGCQDYKGKKVGENEVFQPTADPCMTCTCINGQKNSCLSVKCKLPQNCRKYQIIEGKCCEFKCLDSVNNTIVNNYKKPVPEMYRKATKRPHPTHCFDENGKIVSEGELFIPKLRNVCVKCSCLNGRPRMCVAMQCLPPKHCLSYVKMKGKCCKYQCQDKQKNLNQQPPKTDPDKNQGHCFDSSGQIVKIGSYLSLPGDNLCSECICVGRNRRLCYATDCNTLNKCSDKREEPNSCCGFICNDRIKFNKLSDASYDYEKIDLESQADVSRIFANRSIQSNIQIEAGNFSERQATINERNWNEKELEANKMNESKESNFQVINLSLDRQLESNSSNSVNFYDVVVSANDEQVKKEKYVPKNFSQNMIKDDDIKTVYNTSEELMISKLVIKYKNNSNVEFKEYSTTQATNVYEKIYENNDKRFEDNVGEMKDMYNTSDQLMSSKLEGYSTEKLETSKYLDIEKKEDFAIYSINKSDEGGEIRNTSREEKMLSFDHMPSEFEDIMNITLENRSEVRAMEKNVLHVKDEESENITSYGSVIEALKFLKESIIEIEEETADAANSFIKSLRKSVDSAKDVINKIISSTNTSKILSKSEMKHKKERLDDGISKNKNIFEEGVHEQKSFEEEKFGFTKIKNFTKNENDSFGDKIVIGKSFGDLSDKQSKERVLDKLRDDMGTTPGGVDIKATERQHSSYIKRLINSSSSFYREVDNKVNSSEVFGYNASGNASVSTNKSGKKESILNAIHLLNNISGSLLENYKSKSRKAEKNITSVITDAIHMVKNDLKMIKKRKRMENSCKDYESKEAKVGERFIKKTHPCYQCICLKGFARNCTIGTCKNSDHCNPKLINPQDMCCQFICRGVLHSPLELEKGASKGSINCQQNSIHVIAGTISLILAFRWQQMV